MCDKICESRCSAVLIGAGMGNENMLTLDARTQIEKADACIGAVRLLEVCPKEKPKFAEYRSVEIIKIIKGHLEYSRWAIILSGDVGFYSGAKALTKACKEAEIPVDIVPGIASVVYLAAKLGISWEDAALRSIHGRNQNAIYAIDHHAKTFLLLDRKSGTEFCEQIREYGMEDLICHIGARLSYEDETIRTISAGELTPEDLGELSTMLIENPHPVESVSIHLPDDAFIRSQEGHVVPMTKAEVRAVSMAKLGLTREAVFYDIGAGTGSVSIEAALHGEQVQVYAIEQREDACDLLRANRRKFRAAQVQVIHGSAPEAMEGLPAPTHAFIGGSTGHLHDIIRMLKEKNPEVTLVINAISLETVEEVMRAVRSGLLTDPEIVQMNVAASRVLGRYHMMTGQNPVYIITERK